MSRLRPLVALWILAASTPWTARAVELGGGVGWQWPLTSGTDARPLWLLDASWRPGSWWASRLVMRGSGPMHLQGPALALGSGAVADVVDVAVGWQGLAGLWRSWGWLAVGGGMVYHLRQVTSTPSAAGRAVVVGGASVGALVNVDLADHPGLDGVLEAGWNIAPGWSIGLQATAQYAVTQAYLGVDRDGDARVTKRLWLSALGAGCLLRWQP